MEDFLYKGNKKLMGPTEVSVLWIFLDLIFVFPPLHEDAK